eukprot:Polyplicarium_translucidae@DN995_c0_g1_i2.p5
MLRFLLPNCRGFSRVAWYAKHCGCGLSWRFARRGLTHGPPDRLTIQSPEGTEDPPRSDFESVWEEEEEHFVYADVERWLQANLSVTRQFQPTPKRKLRRP